MTPDDLGRALRIVEGALDLDEAERAAHVRDACGGDAALEAEVLALLTEEGDESFLAPPLASSRSVDLAERFVGRRINEFTIDGVIAGGGMGTVFRATQDHPQRVVALKLLRPTIASATAVERFREEVEILGRLDHPGIARIHDAGTTREAGLDVPWFAMEFVEGARDVLRYATEERLDLRARVELFREILAAVRHGHQRGVIHRDLKPSNLLVDAAGRPRVIDFGVARAVDGERDVLRTATGELVGTLKYMSPEQFAADAGDVDTRTDVFSLGVVLYELLVGGAPFDLAGKSVVDIALAVRDGRMRPPREASPSLPEDLDWIVRRALEPDRERRYENAGALADDLGRWLRDEPVDAGPPTTSYRVRKFVRRHLVGLAVMALVLVLIAAGVLGTVVNWRVAVRERAAAEEESRQATDATEFFAELLQTADPWQEEPDLKVSDLLDRAAASVGERFAGAPAREAMLRTVLGRTYLRLGRPAAAEEQLRIARELERAEGGPLDREAFARGRLHASALSALRRDDAANALVTGLLGRAERRFGPGDVESVELRLELASQRLAVGRGEEALDVLHPLVARWESDAAPDSVRRGIGRVYARVLDRLGRPAEALDVLDETIAILRRDLPDSEPDLAAALSTRATLLRHLGRFPEAAEEQRRVAALVERHVGPDHLRTLSMRGSLAELLLETARFEEAEETLRAVIAAKEEKEEFRPIDLADEQELLARVLATTGRPEEARSLLERSLAARRAVAPDDSVEVLDARARVAGRLAAAGDVERGVHELDAVIDELCAAWRPSLESVVEFARHSIAAFLPDDPRSCALLERLHAATDGREGVSPETSALLLYSLADKLRPQVRLREALAALDEALSRLADAGGEAAPFVTRVRLARAGILNLVGDVGAAEREFEAVLDDLRRSEDVRMLASALWSAAFMFREQRRFVEAERLHRELVGLDLGDESRIGAFSRLHLAELLERRLQDDEAARLFGEAATMTRRVDPRKSREATDGAARSLLAAGRTDDALRLLEEHEEALPSDACSPALHTLQTLYLALGDEEGVRRVAARVAPMH